jgi:general stress protein 26
MKSRGMSQLPLDLQRFLESNTRAFLFGLRKDGSPTGHPMTGIYAQARLFVNTYRKSAKARNIARDSRACYLVVNGYDAEKVYGVAVKGEARILEEGRIPGRRDAAGHRS